jgi:hypothetical protein
MGDEEDTNVFCEAPSIEKALKSYASVMTTLGIVAEDVPIANAANAVGSLHLSASSASSGYNKYVAAGHSQAERCTPRVYEYKAMVMCAKILLKVINAHELPTADRWAEMYPLAGDVTLGSDRIDGLAAFKACALANSQCRGKGEKPGKLFGRRYLHATKSWDTMRPAAEAALLAERTPARMTADFLDGWTRALSESEDGAAGSLASLVWAKDFKGELARHLAMREAEGAACA